MSLRDPATYEQATRHIAALADRDSDERSIIRARMTELRGRNPLLSDALEAHTQRTAEFLLQKAGELGSIPRPGDPFGGKRAPRHSPEKTAKLARYIDAATNPHHALARVERGEIHREDIEALEALYPRMYEALVRGVLLDLGQVGAMPTYEQRLRLGHLLNAPADPSMRPDVLQWLQDTAASQVGPAAEDKQGGPGKMSRRSQLGDIMRTKADTMSGGG